MVFHDTITEWAIKEFDECVARNKHKDISNEDAALFLKSVDEDAFCYFSSKQWDAYIRAVNLLEGA